MSPARYRRVMLWTSAWISACAPLAWAAGDRLAAAGFAATCAASSAHWARHRAGSWLGRLDRACAAGLCGLILWAAAIGPARLEIVAALLGGVAFGYRRCLAHDMTARGMAWHLGFRYCGFWAGVYAFGAGAVAEWGGVVAGATGLYLASIGAALRSGGGSSLAMSAIGRMVAAGDERRHHHPVPRRRSNR